MLHPLRGLIEGQLTQGTYLPSFKAPRFVTLSPTTLSPTTYLHTTILLNEPSRIESNTNSF